MGLFKATQDESLNGKVGTRGGQESKTMENRERRAKERKRGIEKVGKEK